MIFAAGLGVRMGDLTRSRPKPLIPVAGQPLLDYALDIAHAARVSRIVVNSHYHPDQIAAHLKGRALISHETTLLDTGGGLRNAAHLLGASPVFTLNSDTVWAGPNALLSLQEAWRPADMDALLLLVPKSRAHARKGGGDFALEEDGRLRRGGDMIYTGAQIIRMDRLKEMPEGAFSLNLCWDAIAQSGRLSGTLYQGQWCDVGHPEGITKAESMLTGAADV